MKQAQANLAATQLKLASGKNGMTYSDLGSAALPSLSARSMMAREQAYGTTSTQVKQQISFYDTSLTQLSGAASDLYKAVGGIIANGEATGFATSLSTAFSALKETLNTNEGGTYIFGGGQSNSPPFTASAVSDLSTLPSVSSAFQDGSLKAQARVADGTDMVYGITAKDAGLNVATVLKQLNDMGPINGQLTSAQMATISGIYANLKTAMNGVTDVQAANGTQAQQIDTYITQSTNRSDQLQSYVGNLEDADMTSVATELSNDQLALQASYQAFSKIQGMSLVNYLSSSAA